MSIISIIIPVYQAEAYLHRCVDSVLRQTLQDFELILIDDGSLDNSGSICDDYARRDERIHVIHQNNEGLSSARNAGLDWVFSNSRSEWISFIDSDDWVHPRYLKSLFQAVNDNNVQVAACEHLRTKGETPKVDESKLNSIILTAKAYYCGAAGQNPAVVAWGKLYHRDCFQIIRYPIGRWHEDEYVTHRILFPCRKLAWISQPLYAYFQNPDGIVRTANTRKHCLDLMDALYDQIQFFEKRSLRLEIHALRMCMGKIKQAESNPERFTDEDLQHVSEIKLHLTSRHPCLLKTIIFAEHFQRLLKKRSCP